MRLLLLPLDHTLEMLHQYLLLASKFGLQGVELSSMLFPRLLPLRPQLLQELRLLAGCRLDRRRPIAVLVGRRRLVDLTVAIVALILYGSLLLLVAKLELLHGHYELLLLD